MRLPRKQSLVVALQVRGKTLFFQNKLDSVILAFQDTEIADLHWFLNELYKDIVSVKNRVKGKDEPPEPAEHEEEDGDDAEPAKSDDDAGPAEPDRKRRRPGPPEDLQDNIEQAIEGIKGHGECLSVTYFPSKNSFHVVRKSDRSSKDFRIMGLDGLRKGKDLATIKQRFELVLLQIRNHLGASSSSAMPDLAAGP